jgi:hypothetical protein
LVKLESYLHEISLALKNEQRELETRSEATKSHSFLIQKLDSLKHEAYSRKLKILKGVLARRRIRRKRISLISRSQDQEKAEVLSRILSRELKSGKTLLYLAFSDTAADDTLMKVCRTYEKHKHYLSGKIIRFGTCHREEIEKKYARVLPVKYLRLKFKKLDQQIQTLTTKINVLQEKINRIFKINTELKQLKQENHNLRLY